MASIRPHEIIYASVYDVVEKESNVVCPVSFGKSDKVAPHLRGDDTKRQALTNSLYVPGYVPA